MLRGNSRKLMLKQMTTSWSLAPKWSLKLNLLSLARPPALDAKKQTLVNRCQSMSMSNIKLWGLMWWLATCNIATTTITAQPRSTSKCRYMRDTGAVCKQWRRFEFTYNYVLSTLPPIWCVLQLIMLQLTSQPEWCSMLIDMATSAFNTFEWKANSPVWRCWRGT